MQHYFPHTLAALQSSLHLISRDDTSVPGMTAAAAREGSFDFQVVQDSQLDHLVPVEDRVEPGIEQDEGAFCSPSSFIL